MRIGILVNAYARTSELDSCLRSVVKASANYVTTRLLVHQLGVPESCQISEKYREFFEIKYLEPFGENALQRINHNRIFGLRELFENRNMDAVLAIEDDVEIAFDTVNFCVQCLEIYKNNWNFRGINLGSRNEKPNDADSLRQYSLIRYGIHGQAGVITRNTWVQINRWSLLDNLDSGFDAKIEGFMKTGFMVTPNHSRYLDRGFDVFATHAVKNSLHRDFVLNEKSFVGDQYWPVPDNYILKQENHEVWRNDAIEFNKSENIYFWIKFLFRRFTSRLILKRFF